MTAVSVWIVDDQAVFRRAAAAVVTASPGFVVAGEAGSGEAAVAMVGGMPGLVLMDVHMPGIGGVAATRLIRARSPAIMVLLMSSDDPDELPDAVTECGASGYLNKASLNSARLAAVWREVSGHAAGER